MVRFILVFLNSDKPNYKKNASASKVGAYMFPEKYIIYDSRVAYALNWRILSENVEKILITLLQKI
jgi:hypothetical protein|tara:strand:- start:420 stop:617 length:198 start_codon:yes stop_codon:yes gene_type:complete